MKSSKLEVGDKAPAFSAIIDSGEKIKLSQFKGQKVVLYFYPKDDTPGCTTESCDFSDHLTQFKKLEAVVLGVSKDSIESHQKFKKKHRLSFPLISDSDGKICEAYGVWREKKNYGKTYMGIVRSTFVINEKGKIMALFDSVKVAGHVEAVLEVLKS